MPEINVLAGNLDSLREGREAVQNLYFAVARGRLSTTFALPNPLCMHNRQCAKAIGRHRMSNTVSMQLANVPNRPDAGTSC